MCSCFRSHSVLDSESWRKEESKEETVSFSSHIKNTSVRIVHAGGRIELYQNAIPASELIRRYPGMCIARPGIFKRPHESVLYADDILLPGNKYIIIRSTTVEKLKRRHSREGNVNQQAGSDEPILDFKEIKDVGDNFSEESFRSARDFYISKDSWSNHFLKKHVKEKKPFVPPIQRPRMWKESSWEPNLTSIQELSP
ncbi:uncharacterized protein LOC111403382 [Olea europaea var. sylvestris]|uniref:Uncharacterized protein n=1 Tax=Olea europaea subsp. europaea TaxID=158383 RepID=A0A8S0S502_OLEEU|nr:uncharacterized protein LOC111403382 [Olea europaea var. sylvestris]XP_022887640.1 uncharacterized protein LOC111403382 [Olea europaea var. sylvestris]XP_022887641.1 uncharacterized protein LOC111403382 [Olea europaea var. sylvestris]CAA2986710.1 Hypothetical predicted protein [Olea europaea subsp. europaea]